MLTRYSGVLDEGNCNKMVHMLYVLVMYVVDVIGFQTFFVSNEKGKVFGNSE